MVRVPLECIVCASRNYFVKKNRRTFRTELVLKKYCPACKMHTEHRMGK